MCGDTATTKADDGKPVCGDCESLFGPVVFSYTRKQALEDGFQVEIDPKTTQEAGFRYPVYMTLEAYSATIAAGGTWEPEDGGGEVLKLPGCQDVQGRIWDVLTILRVAARQGGQSVRFSVLVDEHGNGKRQRVDLKSTCGPVDYDDPRPAITIMLPEED